MMNNHFHLQPHEHNNTPQNMAQQFGAVAAPTTYSYLTQPTATAATLPNPQQWLTYQILPPTLATNAGGGLTSTLTGTKRFYTNTATTNAPGNATTAATHPSSIQITNNFTQSQQQTQSSPFKTNSINNIRIISTAPNVYSLNKSAEQLNQLYVAPSSTTAAAAATADIYAPVGAYYTAAPKLQPSPLLPVSNSNNTNNSNTNNNNNNNNAASSTVVLDRINICINNHYAEPNLCQPSPIIPAIQHKALLPLIDSSTVDSSCSSSSSSGSVSSCNSNSNARNSVASAAIIVIDEPDSTTTTPHTPPTTPETLSSPLKSPSSPLNSPSSPLNSPTTQLKQSFTSVTKSIEDVAVVTAAAAPPTPPTPPPIALSPAPLSYALQEDVFIKCNDGRFYLGTIIAQNEQQYLVRFDDKSEQWCELEKLRKLGNEPSSGGATTNNSGPMCVACKRAQHEDIVEICERCGRGYHRGCTTEIASGVWCCKRCAKPMKMQTTLTQIEANKPQGICRQLPYHADKLSWDEKHRVNEEQIYCYCGKPGKFDHNMLQCCKCSNWFHTQCMQNFKRKLLRGDIFFVFCCTVCNDGVEYVRRLQIDWVDMLHITLYNLRKHQHQKYHHLLKDIWPFILEQRHQFPICEEWRQLPETSLMQRIKQTLQEYSDRFVCGREFKRAPAYYALRHNGPPLTPRVFLQPHEELCDELLLNKFKLLLLPEEIPAKDSSARDVYEFHTDEDEEDTAEATAEAEAEADSSEDEIPIKQIIEKAKKATNIQSTTQSEVLKNMAQERTIDLTDDNANDGEPGKLLAPISEPPQLETVANGSNSNSRKRKAFRLSKRYDNSRNCDLSSDENSSSSRGTSSLDLIIPPPANFLGRNNPFLMATPKKSTQQRNTGVAASAPGVAGIINSIFKLKSVKQMSSIELAKATATAQQPRMVRTIKRRLSAKDITIGPNQEVRRRRTRRLTTAIEVINTTTINPIPSHYFPIYAKELQPPPPAPSLLPPEKPTHGRLLRQRPQKSRGGSPGNTSRRNSTSSTATNGSSSGASTGATAVNGTHSMLDLKQSVNKYFGGVMNRIDAGEPFAIRAKRRMGNGQVQYLVEWGGESAAATLTTIATAATTTTVPPLLKNEN